jgi:hypothetical protein
MAGGTIKDAQAQLGHTKLSTTLEIYTLPVTGHPRMAVENLAQTVTSRAKVWNDCGQRRSKFNEMDGGRYRIRTYDFHRVKMALYR